MKAKSIFMACAIAMLPLMSWQAMAQAGDGAVEQYRQIEQMLAVDRRCAWLPPEGLERAALWSSRNERRAWLEASGRILAAELVARDIDAGVANVPCAGPQGDPVRQQVQRAAWELGAEWLIRAQALQASYRVSRLKRPEWFHGVDTLVSGEIEPAISALRQQVPEGMVERAQDQALADASRWMLLLCRDWKAGLMYAAGTCPAVPAADKAYVAYAEAWRQAAADFQNALWALASKQPAMP